MPPRKSRGVLFLCTGNYYRSRFAEILFNHVSARMGLPWVSASRGLALERGSDNVGPIAVEALRALEARQIRAVAEVTRMPLAVAVADFEQADWVVALKETEHRPLLEERFPAWTEKVEFWHVDDAPGVLDLIETEVLDLSARLIGGRKREERPPEETCTGCGHPKSRCVCRPVEKKPAGPPPVVRVGRETKGRRGKGVTIVSDVPLDAAGLQELAATLKQRCGTGGTVKDGQIEIQGDMRDRLMAVLQELGYRVKRAGG